MKPNIEIFTEGASPWYDSQGLCVDNLEEILTFCQKEGYFPLFIPTLADVLGSEIKDHISRLRDYSSSLLLETCSAPSTRVIGKTDAGKKIVVYAHIPITPITYPNLSKFKKTKSEAIILERKEFKELVAQDGRTDSENNRLVYVLDESEIRRSKKINHLDKHHQCDINPDSNEDSFRRLAPPFFGSEDRARRFIKSIQETESEITYPKSSYCKNGLSFFQPNI